MWAGMETCAPRMSTTSMPSMCGCANPRRCRATSQPSVGDFRACYEPLITAGRDVVSVHIAAGISGTCEARPRRRAPWPKKGHPGRIEVVDSQTGAGGLGCLVVAAARAAEQGAGLDAVVDTVRQARQRLEIWFCLDTLEYLRRGGRIGAAQAMLGTALKVKPILTFGTEISPSAASERRSALWSGWTNTCVGCTTAAPRTGSCNTPSRPRTPSIWSLRAPRSSARVRCSAPRWAGARHAPRLRNARRGRRARLS